jgi:hypothetical protein
MPRYWKACSVQALRTYPQWVEPSSAIFAGGDTPDILFLDEGRTVRLHPHPDATAVFSDATTAWAVFCADRLGFARPNWDAEATSVTARLADDSPSS